MFLFNSSQTRIKGFLFLFPFYKGLIFVLLFCTFLGACSSKSDSDSSNTDSSNTGSPDSGSSGSGSSNTGPSNTGPSNTGPSNTGPSDSGSSNTGPSDSGSSNRGNKIIAAGAAHTCIILNDGSVKCLGKNDSGETEGGTPDLGGKTATHIAAGLHHTCAILNDGSIKCWGNTGYSQIGRRLSNLGGKTAIHITAGTSHTCAILNDNSVRCWGKVKSGQIGGGSPFLNTRTILGTEGNPLSGQTATQIEAGNFHTCAILNDGSVKCWGKNVFDQTGGGTQNSKNSRALSGTVGNPLSGDQTATQIAAGVDHTCAILDDDGVITNGGPVQCWGDNRFGQTGGGSKKSDDTHTLSGTVGNPLSGQITTYIEAGNNHTCAILSDDSVKCWGSNTDGQTNGGTPISLD